MFNFTSVVSKFTFFLMLPYSWKLVVVDTLFLALLFSKELMFVIMIFFWWIRFRHVIDNLENWIMGMPYIFQKWNILWRHFLVRIISPNNCVVTRQAVSHLNCYIVYRGWTCRGRNPSELSQPKRNLQEVFQGKDPSKMSKIIMITYMLYNGFCLWLWIFTDCVYQIVFL